VIKKATHLLLLLLTIFVNISFANTSNKVSEQLHIKALKLDDNTTTTVASGGVVAYSPSYYITASKMIYDKNSSILNLFGNVNLVKNCQVQTVSDEAIIYLDNDNMDISPFFMKVEENQMWINSTDAILRDDIYYFENSVMSSCRSDKPEWWFEFTSAKFDTKAKWIDTYNARIYVQHIPILYLPYFGFHTYKDRKSGLLVPTIGYSKYEGFEYSQPIFYAPADNYDFEFVPQTRNKRGKGIYTYFRY
jgi:LPS-assembly protein